MRNDINKELTEIGVLLILRKKALSSLELIFAIDKYLDIDNIIDYYSMIELHRKGYVKYAYEERDGENTTLYCITEKGLKRIEKFFALYKAISDLIERTE